MPKMICQNSTNIVECIVNLHRHVEYVVVCLFSQRISLFSICQLQFIFSIFITMKRVNRPSELLWHSLAWFCSSTFMQQRIDYLFTRRILTHTFTHTYILFAFVAVSNSYCIIILTRSFHSKNSKSNETQTKSGREKYFAVKTLSNVKKSQITFYISELTNDP